MPQIEDIIIGFKNNDYTRTLIAYLRQSIFTFLWGLLFWIPGIIKSISYSQMFYLLNENKNMDAAEAQRKSMEIMEGHKMDYFVMELSFIPWWLLVGVTLGIAAVYVVPYVEASKAEFHNRLIGKSPLEKAADKIEEAVEVVKAKTTKKKKTKK